MDNITNIIVILILALILFFAVRGGAKRLRGGAKRLRGGCCGSGGKVKKVKAANTDKSHYEYKCTVYIDGMTCEHCKARVENAFNILPGCLCEVNLAKKCAEVWSETEMSEEELRSIVEKAGYVFVK